MIDQVGNKGPSANVRRHKFAERLGFKRSLTIFIGIG